MNDRVGPPLSGILRFALELAALAAVAAGGWRWGGHAVPGALLAVGAPLLVAIVWGQFVAPRAPRYLPESGRIAVEIAVFGTATGTLATLGHPGLAIAFALLAGANTTLIHVRRHDQLTRADIGTPIPKRRWLLR